jgi:hypothetical protein
MGVFVVWLNVRYCAHDYVRQVTCIVRPETLTRDMNIEPFQFRRGHYGQETFLIYVT